MEETRHDRIQKLLRKRMVEQEYFFNEEEFDKEIDFSLWTEQDYISADIWLSEGLPEGSIPEKLQLQRPSTEEPKEEKPYREGDEPSNAQQEKKTVGGREPPITAFLVLKYPNQVEVVLNLPGFKMDHPASLRDIRDCALVVSQDATTTITAQATAQEFAKHMAVASKGAIQGEVAKMLAMRKRKQRH